MQGFTAIFRNRWMPLIITSLFFGLMHSWNPEVKEFGFLQMMPQYVLFGLVFGTVTIIDDGVEIATGAHAANNVFLSIMVTNRSSTLQTPAMFEQHEIYPWIEFSGLLISSAAFLVILTMILKWQNFRILLEKIKR